MKGPSVHIRGIDLLTNVEARQKAVAKKLVSHEDRPDVPPPTGETTKVRDTAKTRAKILQVATKEFAARGFDGARVDRIATRCKLSKNTLYYHFESKEGLLIAVLENMYAKLRSRQDRFSLPHTDPEKAIEAFARQTFWGLVENPDMIRLLNDENLHQGRHLKKSSIVPSLYDPLFNVIQEVLDRGQKDGTFREGLDALSVYIIISSVSYHLVSNRFTLETTFDRDFSSPAALEKWADHVAETTLLVCRAAPAPQAEAPKVATG